MYVRNGIGDQNKTKIGGDRPPNPRNLFRIIQSCHISKFLKWHEMKVSGYNN